MHGNLATIGLLIIRIFSGPLVLFTITFPELPSMRLVLKPIR